MASDNNAAAPQLTSQPRMAPRHEPVVPQDVAEQRNTMLAWERFVAGESLAHTPVDGVLLGSWQRSRSFGVSPIGRLAPLAADGDALERLRLRHGDLMQAYQGFFESTAEALLRSQSIILLTDPRPPTSDPRHGTGAGCSSPFRCRSTGPSTSATPKRRHMPAGKAAG